MFQTEDNERKKLIEMTLNINKRQQEEEQLGKLLSDFETYS